MPCWVDTAQPDPQAATRFYGELFGWTFVDRMPAELPGDYFVAHLRGLDVAAVSSQAPDAAPAPAWNTYIWVDDADATTRRVREAGGQVLAEPFDVVDAGRTAVFADPAGAVFSVWQPGRHRGAQVVNEPGSWNWSDLYTSDVEGSKAFYGAVFGWEASTVNFGDEDITMWRVPGYSDLLEALYPGVRQRHVDYGAPEGFSDAIGWMMPLADEGTPPQWSVTFAVDDADATADRAARARGTVIVPPTDAGPVRLAVLRDPQGAVFSVSRFNPGG